MKPYLLLALFLLLPLASAGLGYNNPNLPIIKLPVVTSGSGTTFINNSYINNTYITQTVSNQTIIDVSGWFHNLTSSGGDIAFLSSTAYNIGINKETLRLKANGFIGSGTSTPEDQIHMNGTATGMILESGGTSGSSSGDYLQILQGWDGSQLATGDRLGSVFFSGKTNATQKRNPVGIIAYASDAWTTSTFPTYLSFETTETNARTEKMRILGNGNINFTGDLFAHDFGLYFNTTNNNLDVKGTAKAKELIVDDLQNSSGTNVLIINSSGSITMPKQSYVAASTTGQTITNAAYNTVIYGSEQLDRIVEYNNNTGIFTVLTEGVYSVVGSVSWANADGGGVLYRLDLQASSYCNKYSDYTGGASARVTQEISAACYMTPNQTIYIRAYQNSGGNESLVAEAGLNKLTITKVS